MKSRQRDKKQSKLLIQVANIKKELKQPSFIKGKRKDGSVIRTNKKYKYEDARIPVIADRDYGFVKKTYKRVPKKVLVGNYNGKEEYKTVMIKVLDREEFVVTTKEGDVLRYEKPHVVVHFYHRDAPLPNHDVKYPIPKNSAAVLQAAEDKYGKGKAKLHRHDVKKDVENIRKHYKNKKEKNETSIL